MQRARRLMRQLHNPCSIAAWSYTSGFSRDMASERGICSFPAEIGLPNVRYQRINEHGWFRQVVQRECRPTTCASADAAVVPRFKNDRFWYFPHFSIKTTQARLPIVPKPSSIIKVPLLTIDMSFGTLDILPVACSAYEQPTETTPHGKSRHCSFRRVRQKTDTGGSREVFPCCPCALQSGAWSAF